MEVEGEDVRLMVWDSGGADRFREISRAWISGHLRDADGYVLVYDCNVTTLAEASAEATHKGQTATHLVEVRAQPRRVLALRSPGHVQARLPRRPRRRQASKRGKLPGSQVLVAMKADLPGCDLEEGHK